MSWIRTETNKQRPTASCKAATGHETRDERVPHILLSPHAFQDTVEQGQHSTPGTKGASCCRYAELDSGQSADATCILSYCCQRDFMERRRVVVSTRGEFIAPLTPYQIVLGTAPTTNADPQSERMIHGLYSLISIARKCSRDTMLLTTVVLYDLRVTLVLGRWHSMSELYYMAEDRCAG